MGIMVQSSLSLEQPFIKLDDVILRVGDRLLFEHTNWQINANQHWVIVGPTGSGKSTLANAIFRRVPVANGNIRYFFERANDKLDPGRPYFNRGEIVRISSESHSNLMRQQGSYHQARWQSFEGGDSITASDLLTGASIEHVSTFDVSPLKVSEAVYSERRRYAIELLGIEYLLDRKMLHLSNGEGHKVLIARALMQSPKLLILDDPFTGLDTASRHTLQNAIDGLLAAGSPQILLVIPRLDEIPEGVTHVLRVADCRVVEKGPKDKVLPAEIEEEDVAAAHSDLSSYALAQFPVGSLESNMRVPILVDMKDTSVSYGGTTVLHNINWTMKQGENWAVLGANGAGKTTILSLILADNPQAYANKITLFGIKRGSGESVWDIKRNIGWVSPELQAFHQKRTTCFNAVCSGFFDSVGLYKSCSPEQENLAKHWMDSFGILNLADRSLDTVSAGEQRLVFLARALVKNPALLILDEPCQGLDFSNQTRINNLLDQLCRQTSVNLIYVTHHFEEIPQAITHVLKLEKGRILANGTRKDILG